LHEYCILQRRPEKTLREIMPAAAGQQKKNQCSKQSEYGCENAQTNINIATKGNSRQSIKAINALIETVNNSV